MKDTILTAQRKKKELIAGVVCFLLANLANVYAIIAYETPAIELLTSMGYVLVATVFLYGVWCMLRLFYYGMKSILIKKK